MNDFLKKNYSKVIRSLSDDIGVDLGTANTLVYVVGRGIVMNEPSVVAINQKTGRVVAIGNEARSMLGRTPTHISAVKPVVDGVISDFEVTEEMLSYLITKTQKDKKKWFGPKVVVGVPSGVTNVERRAVRDAVKSAGAREVHIVEQPMAAAIGMRLPILDPVGTMVIDIGGGTTDIAVISLGGIVNSKSLKIAGNRLNNDIVNYVRDEFKILIGERTAEDLKIAIGSLIEGPSPLEATVRGRDLITGLPREVVITDGDMREAIGQSVDSLIEASKEVIETTPPEVLSDIMNRGAHIVGGGALMQGLDSVLKTELDIPIHVAPEPLTAVVRGTGIILENIDMFSDVLIRDDDDEFSTKV